MNAYGINPDPSEITEITPAVDGVESIPLPLYGYNVSAGFPSPADDFIEEYLDLNQLLVKHREATFFVRVSGCSMTGAGIYSGDILIVDRSLDPAHGKIVIAVVSGELTVKRLVMRNGRAILRSENPNYPDIPAGDELRVWGVVTSVIHKV
ncbi:translesion error-prone DNA polymerase V autoproteolytic subunit [candidate division WOR-3 bacterium]|uniref:Translesion error-prone DNA polymerase V autoproteolytic subunit n=1 Tax=candidate division WOR-3 bacterium TaxID=2052148 RepID=A0A9D5QD10_UNCW3|nr:translesion error-prone DNA polymerase V autoproteolytic subunit [candidate division WOR-3 bacterium]MBD3364617.1 translesion error-prone DNA polymerase V autoproteolytic subunit [candidate division WOR-3 bacterium]